jgi:hypothetical protein
LIEEAFGVVARLQEHLDTPSQLDIGCALAIQEGGASRRLVPFDGLEEHGSNTIRVERHRMVPGWGSRVRTP